MTALLAAVALLPAAPGLGVARTMSLLAASTATHRRTVRILFYGQSITADQPWTRAVIDDLSRRFPTADIHWENRAISGFSANLLKRTALADVPTFRPDLVVLHDYGSEPDYEELVQTILSATSAEVAVMDDHSPFDPGPNASEDEKKRFAWHDAHSAWLRDLARRYQLEFIDVRGRWKDYLKQTAKTPKDVTLDGTHPNAEGNALMAAVVAPQLRYEGKPPTTPWVQELAVPSNLRKFDFVMEGNRLDLLPSVSSGKAVAIKIDGKPPSQIPACTVHGRSSVAANSWMPLLLHIGSKVPALAEEWKLTVTWVSPDDRALRFRLRGSVTGEDGEGASDQDFVSKSGRVAIAKADWNIGFPLAVSKRPTPVGFEATWRTTNYGVDEFRVPEALDSTLENAQTVAILLGPGKHKVELTATEDGPLPLRAVRIFRPRLP